MQLYRDICAMTLAMTADRTYGSMKHIKLALCSLLFSVGHQSNYVSQKIVGNRIGTVTNRTDVSQKIVGRFSGKPDSCSRYGEASDAN